MTIFLISAIICAVIAYSWYNKKKQAIYDEYQKQMEQYLNQLDEPQQQQTVEEHYTMFFKMTDEQHKRFFDPSSNEDY